MKNRNKTATTTTIMRMNGKKKGKKRNCVNPPDDLSRLDKRTLAPSPTWIVIIYHRRNIIIRLDKHATL